MFVVQPSHGVAPIVDGMKGFRGGEAKNILAEPRSFIMK